MVAALHRRDARPDVDDDAGALMAEDRREQALRIGAGKGEVVGMADAGRLDLDQHLAGLRAIELNGHDFERLARLDSDCGANIHGALLLFPANRTAGSDARGARRRPRRVHRPESALRQSSLAEVEERVKRPPGRPTSIARNGSAARARRDDAPRRCRRASNRRTFRSGRRARRSPADEGMFRSPLRRRPARPPRRRRRVRCQMSSRN